MAFMMPVMKNNYDIYKDRRSRKNSETSAPGGANNSSTASAMGINPSRSRPRMKSESFATTSPSNTQRMQMQRCQSQKTFPRNASRSSTTSGVLSPNRSFCQPQGSGSPPKIQQTSSTSNNNNNNNSGSNQNETQNDISKFHLRLVEKLRKSFRKDTAKRS